MSQAGKGLQSKAERYVAIREATRTLQSDGSSEKSVMSNLTTAPFKQLGWAPGDDVCIRVERKPGGDGRIIIESNE